MSFQPCTSSKHHKERALVCICICICMRAQPQRAFPDSLFIPTLTFSSLLSLPQPNKRVEVEINVSIQYYDMPRKGFAVKSHLAGEKTGRAFSSKFTDSGLFTGPSFQIFACLALLVLHIMLHMCHAVICANAICTHISFPQ